MIRPLRDQILVKLFPSIANNGGLLVAPDVKKWRGRDGAIEGENIGSVHSVGPGIVTPKGIVVPVSVYPGDVVRFSELEYPYFTENGETYVLIREADILFVEEREAQEA